MRLSTGSSKLAATPATLAFEAAPGPTRRVIAENGFSPSEQGALTLRFLENKMICAPLRASVVPGHDQWCRLVPEPWCPDCASTRAPGAPWCPSLGALTRTQRLRSPGCPSLGVYWRPSLGTCRGCCLNPKQCLGSLVELNPPTRAKVRSE